MLATETVPAKKSPVPARVWRSGRRLRLLWRVLLAGVVLTVGLEAWRVLLGSNIHVAVPGLAYRGAQPSAAELEDLLERYQIRTVINLRGTCDPAPWFIEEARTTQRLQICQEDICFSSGRLPSDQELRRLVDVLDHAEYPVFFHCRRGADRTGMAAAVYVLLKTEGGLAGARAQLGLRYGHVPMSRTALMDVFLDLYAAWLKANGKEHGRDLFRHWLLHEYRGAGYGYRIERFVCAATLTTRQPGAFQVRVRNTGTKSWQLSPVGTGGFKLGFSLRDEQDMEAATGFAGLFDAVVEPGEAIDLTLVVPPVKRTGRYRLMVDMLDNEFVWFFQMGSEPSEEELLVRE